MSSARSAGLAGTLARAVVGVCFVGGAVSALAGRLVLAGTAFLAGHTLLATAAVAQGQRRRSVGMSLSGVGWLALSVGLGVGGDSGGSALEPLATPLLVAGIGLVTVGTLLVVGARGGSGGGGDVEREEAREGS